MRAQDEAHRLRSAAAASGWPRVFAVQGTVDGEPVRAFWCRRRLVATLPLLRRAHLLVAMGEHFDADETSRPSVVAGLDDPLEALLTLVRACDHVSAVQIGPLRIQASDPPLVASPHATEG